MFRETPESTFMDAFDSRWVTDFNAMVAEFTLKGLLNKIFAY